MYTVATISWFPNVQCHKWHHNAASYSCKKKISWKKGWWGKEKEKQQLTCAVATCTNSVPMHHWCWAASCALMPPLMLPPVATMPLPIVAMPQHCLLLLQCCSQLLVLRRGLQCKGRRKAGEERVRWKEENQNN